MSNEINGELLLDPAPPEPTQSRFATVVTVDTAQGMQLQMDGEEESSEKFYPYLQHTAGAQLGDRVLVEYISGTMIVTGIVAPPFRELTVTYADEAGHAAMADSATEAENAVHALSADTATLATTATSAVNASNAANADSATLATFTYSARDPVTTTNYIRFRYTGGALYYGVTSSPMGSPTWYKLTQG